MTTRRRVVQSALLLATAPSFAQAFPAKPIRYIVPVPAGGGSDFIGRTVTQRWGRLLGQTFVVDNIGGGGAELIAACNRLGTIAGVRELTALATPVT